MKLVKAKEGETEVLVPEHEKGLGPRSVDGEVFYNPAMELNRDISISFLNSWGDGDKKVLDGMAATGIRGIRLAKEVNNIEVVLTDLSKESFELIDKNIEYTGAEADVVNESIEIHLLKNRYRYDYVDIDPFGSPVPYLPTALRFISRGGVAAVTATDTAVLCGTHKKKCIRRYSSVPENNWCRHENGLRILIAHCAREAARYDRGIEPLTSYYDGHHFRTYIKVNEGAKEADSVMAKLENFSFKGYRWEKGGEKGPFWTGPLFDDDVLQGMKPVGELEDELLCTWRDESGYPPFFYDSNILGKRFKRAPPRLGNLVGRLNDMGYPTSKTHFSSTGFKTEASAEEVKRVFLDCSGTRNCLN